jgi:hypothetical protein
MFNHIPYYVTNLYFVGRSFVSLSSFSNIATPENVNIQASAFYFEVRYVVNSAICSIQATQVSAVFIQVPATA